MKPSKVALALTFSLIGLTGCAGDNQNAGIDNNYGVNDARYNVNNNNRNNFRVNDARFNGNRNNLGVNNVRNNGNNRINNVRNNENTNEGNLRVSTRAINSVERLRDVDRAHVIIRNNDAYVAVRLNNNRNRTDAGTMNQMNATGNKNGNQAGTVNIAGADNPRGFTGYNADMRPTGSYDNNADPGVGGFYENNSNKAAHGILGNGTNTGKGGVTNYLGQIRNAGNGNGTANIAGTNNAGDIRFSGYNADLRSTGRYDNNADPGVGGFYENFSNKATHGILGNGTNTGKGGVGAYLGQNGTAGNGSNFGIAGAGNTANREASTPLEQRIVDQVRGAENNIQNVYVSYDTAFYNQMNTYADDIQTGRNQDNMWDNFGNTIQRYFD